MAVPNRRRTTMPASHDDVNRLEDATRALNITLTRLEGLLRKALLRGDEIAAAMTKLLDERLPKKENADERSHTDPDA